MAATQNPPMIEQERAQAFLALGFSPPQALVLAATRSDGKYVDTGGVQRMLEAGCTHETALRIFV